jgi:hypothetical protein
MFTDEISRCFGIIKIGFDCVFGATSSWEIGYSQSRISKISGFVVCGEIGNSKKRRTETDGIGNTSRALLRAGRTLEQVRFKETITSEKFYASIKFDFGLTYPYF